MTRIRRRHDDGSLTLFTALASIALLVAVAFVVDAGAKLDAAEQARGIAEQAARAGAGQVSQSAAYTGAGQFVTDPAQAAAAARAWLSHSGHTGLVTVAGNQAIQVTVTVTEQTAVTAALGIASLSATETATATLAQGVTGSQP